MTCVGDDWQSIFRFSGSDITLFNDFGKFFGYNKEYMIEKTYRNSQNLIDVASTFIEKNPYQKKKNLKSERAPLEKAVKIIVHDDKPKDALSGAVRMIIEKHEKHEKSEILVLDMYNLNDKEFEDIGIKVSGADKQKKYTFYEYPSMKFSCKTIHGSKGLEADNVILLNMNTRGHSFPSTKNDDSIISLFLNDAENFLYAEERRLFYVALTRTKNYTYILNSKNKPSDFVNEIKNHPNVELTDYKLENPLEIQLTDCELENLCPVCKIGFLIEKTNKKENKKFMGCSRYQSGCDYSISIEAFKENPRCPKCNCYLENLTGPYGPYKKCPNKNCK